MIAIIDYDTGNLRSVCNALDRIGAEYILTDDPDVIAKADRVLLPGVGEASTAMAKLAERGLCGHRHQWHYSHIGGNGRGIEGIVC